MTKDLAAQYEELVAAIVKAVPEIVTFQHSRNCSCRCGGKQRNLRPITLDDVLMAMNKKWRYRLLMVEGFWKVDPMEQTYNKDRISVLDRWSLGHSLEWHRDNAPETIDLLRNLICD